MEDTLTSKQQRVLNFIKDYTSENFMSPTYEEIAKALDLKYVNSVRQYLTALEEKGFINIEEHKSRGIRLMASIIETINIPVVGSVSCGTPLFAEANIQGYIPVQKNFLKNIFKRYFFLKAEGDSMNEAGIEDGDMLLVESTNSANPGDKILALIGDEATIKFYKLGNGYAVLLPKSSNPEHKPIIVKENLSIQGIVVEIIKSRDLEI
ncbi:TPA: repressor LexA [candidate division CPR2 bacterium]|uniref:LexA repressor n=1 Tax=candidate division CPR2 bacterium GW2011_GWC1_41_48 TaxID=1618344 RepID=A0A0G0W9I9_UNCC2|nr:MAG: LexA repressor [candidate division CPR2 bacterium GW2011_GWC2_39_35]KKR28210.1 MAG: LexA repressor [candidate division CPR2 bacterium GW2011_GWD2_39_7]KKR28641.1 MAG: LexA repressor [candidate division CPR2 bacterium GW2011_GWD1_39_7]KKS09615.1 MAG: LexA repressor [candidate division CPR2 bacterium GW2011_GWC1_41_48]OGB61324.1 MAG: repressor LexA [candidate division CPR2 bacterium GWD1_39_7]OGB72360.1 MAG: repressor LexA [candidate division CPR2 bacterium GWD2_39_7]HBG81410.1 represso